jgi:uncharacterized protein YdhG (YjbR/CyaY superfamily)
MEKLNVTGIDEYLQAYEGQQREILEKVRETIHQAAPDATEAMAYGMLTFRLNGNLVHFAASKNHLGFYPTPSAIVRFGEELAGYKTSKGAIQFPFGKEIPYELITRMVRFRVEENLAKKK